MNVTQFVKELMKDGKERNALQIKTALSVVCIFYTERRVTEILEKLREDKYLISKKKTYNTFYKLS